jgi:hypothetical protein
MLCVGWEIKGVDVDVVDFLERGEGGVWLVLVVRLGFFEGGEDRGEERLRE